MYTLRKGLSFISITKSNLQSSQQRVSEDLIHWLRQAWWTKLRLPVQRQGIINGHSSSPSQWQILQAHTENMHTLDDMSSWNRCCCTSDFFFYIILLNLILTDDLSAQTHTLTCRPPAQSHQSRALVCHHSHRNVSVVWALTCLHLLFPSPGISW